MALFPARWHRVYRNLHTRKIEDVASRFCFYLAHVISLSFQYLCFQVVRSGKNLGCRVLYAMYATPANGLTQEVP